MDGGFQFLLGLSLLGRGVFVDFIFDFGVDLVAHAFEVLSRYQRQQRIRAAGRLLLLGACLGVVCPFVRAYSRLKRDRVHEGPARVVRVKVACCGVACRRRGARWVDCLAPLRDHLVGIVQVVQVVDLFRDAILTDAVLADLVCLFEILVAHDVIVAPE